MIKDYYKELRVYNLIETKGDFGEIVKTYSFVGVVEGLINDPGPEKQSIIASKYQVLNGYNLYTEINELVDQHKYIKSGSDFYSVITNAKDTVKRGHHLKFILERLDTSLITEIEPTTITWDTATQTWEYSTNTWDGQEI